jgi:tRNA wybutosine-synthesizing protein 3
VCWVYVSHYPTDLDAVVEQLFDKSWSRGAGNELVLRFEPMIIAMECRDATAAAALVAAAVGVGFRESGELCDCV